MTSTPPLNMIDENARTIADLALRRFAEGGNRRVLLAIAGAPGSGKSTLAERAVERINRNGAASAALFPMDGFHYDDMVLDAMGRRARKGAIDTFDVHGLRHMLQRLKDNDEEVVAIPVFDRAIEIARAGARLVPQSTGIMICEGNYLLVEQAPWSRLRPLFDLTVFVDVTEAELRRRLRRRWERYGLDADEITAKIEENDVPNGLFVMSSSVHPDLRIENM